DHAEDAVDHALDYKTNRTALEKTATRCRRCQWICRRNRLRPACRENILPRTTRYRFVSNEHYKTATFFFLGTNVYRFYSQSDEYVDFPDLRLDCTCRSDRSVYSLDHCWRDRHLHFLCAAIHPAA